MQDLETPSPSPSTKAHVATLVRRGRRRQAKPTTEEALARWASRSVRLQDCQRFILSHLDVHRVKRLICQLPIGPSQEDPELDLDAWKQLIEDLYVSAAADATASGLVGRQSYLIEAIDLDNDVIGSHHIQVGQDYETGITKVETAQLTEPPAAEGLVAQSMRWADRSLDRLFNERRLTMQADQERAAHYAQELREMREENRKLRDELKELREMDHEGRLAMEKLRHAQQQRQMLMEKGIFPAIQRITDVLQDGKARKAAAAVGALQTPVKAAASDDWVPPSSPSPTSAAALAEEETGGDEQLELPAADGPGVSESGVVLTPKHLELVAGTQALVDSLQPTQMQQMASLLSPDQVGLILQLKQLQDALGFDLVDPGDEEQEDDDEGIEEG